MSDPKIIFPNLTGLMYDGVSASAIYNNKLIWPVLGVPAIIVGDQNVHVYASAFENGVLVTSWDTDSSASATVPTGSEILFSSQSVEYYRNNMSAIAGMANFEYNSAIGRQQSASGTIDGDSVIFGVGSSWLNTWTATGSGNRTASSNLAVSAALVTRAFTGENVTATVGGIGANFLNKDSSACSAKLSGNLHYTGSNTNVLTDNQDWQIGKYSARRFGFYRSGVSVGYMTGRLNATSTNANGSYDVTAAANNSTPPFSYYIGPTTAYYKPNLSNPPRMTATYNFTATGIAP